MGGETNNGGSREERLLTSKQVAEVLGIHERTVWRLAREDENGHIALPPVRIGWNIKATRRDRPGRRITRFRRSDVDRLIADGLEKPHHGGGAQDGAMA